MFLTAREAGNCWLADSRLLTVSLPKIEGLGVGGMGETREAGCHWGLSSSSYEDAITASPYLHLPKAAPLNSITVGVRLRSLTLRRTHFRS